MISMCKADKPVVKPELRSDCHPRSCGASSRDCSLLFYPEYWMFVPLPTCGIFYRHANGLVFNRVDIQPQKSDPLPALVFSDVQDVTMDGSPVSASVIRSTSVSGAMKTYPAIESSGYHHVKNA